VDARALLNACCVGFDVGMGFGCLVRLGARDLLRSGPIHSNMETWRGYRIRSGREVSDSVKVKATEIGKGKAMNGKTPRALFSSIQLTYGWWDYGVLHRERYLEAQAEQTLTRQDRGVTGIVDASSGAVGALPLRSVDTIKVTERFDRLLEPS